MASRSRPRLVQVEEWLLLIAVAANLAVALSARHFPYQDAVNHLARYALIERVLSGHAPDWITLQFVPTAYIGGDLIGAALVHCVGPFLTFRLLGLMPLLFLPAGMYALLRVTAPAQVGWALLGSLFTFNVFYLEGFLSYTLGLALVFFWLAYWWPRRTSVKRRHRVVLALGALALYLVHLAAPLIVVGVVWLDYVHELLREWKERRIRPPLVNSRLAMALAVSVPLALVWAVSQAMTWSDSIILPVPHWRPWLTKIRYVTYPLYVFSPVQFGLMLSGFVLAGLFFLAVRLRQIPSSALLWSGVVFLGLYFISPANSAADVRWLPIAYLLPFCAPGRGRRVPMPALVTMLVFSLVNAGLVHVRANRIDLELDTYDRVLERLPEGARILPLVSDGYRDEHVRPYFHYALWETVLQSSRVAGLFSRDNVLEGHETWRHFDHFRLVHTFYFPDDDWGTRRFDSLDCGRIRRDYDLIIHAGQDARAGDRIEECATPAFRLGEITVYHTATGSWRPGGRDR